MKRTILALLISSVALMSFQKAKDVLQSAFKTGNAHAIMDHVGAQLDLAIDGTEKVYSHAQAELVLREFFKSHRPTSFVLDHTGETENTTYHIGTLQCAKDTYRVTYYTHKQSEKIVVDQIRLDKQSANDD